MSNNEAYVDAAMVRDAMRYRALLVELPHVEVEPDDRSVGLDGYTAVYFRPMHKPYPTTLDEVADRLIDEARATPDPDYADV